jgi:hypothetical protein
MVDFVGKVENMHSDFSTVCERIGISPISIGHSNRSQETGSDIRAEDRALLQERYRKDIERFEYGV